MINATIVVASRGKPLKKCCFLGGLIVISQSLIKYKYNFVSGYMFGFGFKRLKEES
jgi:hypothetical protein